MALWRRLLAEALGSAFLAAVVIGSGIAAQRLSPGNVGLELFENAAATAGGLFTIILMSELSREAISIPSSPSWTPLLEACPGGMPPPTCPLRWLAAWPVP